VTAISAIAPARSTHWLIVILAGLVVACAPAAGPTVKPSIAVTRPAFSLSLPPHWRVVDPNSATFDADYRSLVAENADFGTAFPQNELRAIVADAIAFDFTPGRSDPTGMPTLVVCSATLAAEEQARSTQNYLYELLGATNVTTKDMRVGNASGKRITLDYPVRREPADILRGVAPTPGGNWLRQTSFHAYPDFGGVIVLTFVSRLELADAYASEFQTIADTFVANKP